MIPWRARHWMKHHVAVLPPKAAVLTHALRARIVDTLRPDTEAFFSLLGRRVPAWAEFA